MPEVVAELGWVGFEVGKPCYGEAATCSSGPPCYGEAATCSSGPKHVVVEVHEARCLRGGCILEKRCRLLGLGLEAPF